MKNMIPDMIPLPYFIYYIVVFSIITVLVCMATFRVDKFPPSITNPKHEFITLVLNMESEWAKALTNVSLLVLTASLASLFTPVKNDSTLFCLIGIMAIGALFNLFFSVYIHLCGFFSLSFRAGGQNKNKLHVAFYRICIRLGRYWHLFPFVVSFIQLIIAGHILVSLFFTTGEWMK